LQGLFWHGQLLDDIKAIQDRAGNDAANLTDQAVTNNTVALSYSAISVSESRDNDGSIT
jgi:hypothetical protein